MSNKDLKFTEAKWTPETDVDKIKPLNIEDDDFCERKRPFTCPPQSWCYVEEVQ